MAGKASTWVGGTVVLGVLVAAGGWFGAISPTLTSASSAASDAQAADDRNAQLQKQLATLKKQFERLDEYRAELALARTEIPSVADLANFTRAISTLADSAGTNIISIAPGVPTVVTPALPPVPVPTEPAPADTAAGDAEGEAPADGTAAPVTPEPPAAIPGFVAVPVEVIVVSNMPSAITFLNSLQAASQRLFLVTALNGTGQGEQEASGGRPATAEGDVELSITGYIYVLTQEAPAAPTDPDAPRAPLPVPEAARDLLTGA